MAYDLSPGWVDRLVWQPGEGADEQRGPRPPKAKTGHEFASMVRRGNGRSHESKRLDRVLDAVLPGVEE